MIQTGGLVNNNHYNKIYSNSIRKTMIVTNQIIILQYFILYR